MVMMVQKVQRVYLASAALEAEGRTGPGFAWPRHMLSVSRHLMLGLLGLMLVACFNTTKNTKVEPGATSPQPAYSCQPFGNYCTANDECCTHKCDKGTCVEH
jgi:hypothetical protein